MVSPSSHAQVEAKILGTIDEYMQASLLSTKLSGGERKQKKISSTRSKGSQKQLENHWETVTGHVQNKNKNKPDRMTHKFQKDVITQDLFLETHLFGAFGN
jgi:hypothetical protein